jgi:transposase
VVSDVMGKAARLVLAAIVEGETDAVRLASFAAGRVRASQQDLERALTGKVTAHHRFMLGQHLQLIEHLDEAIRRVTEELARRFTPPDPPTEEEEHPPTSGQAPESPESAPSSAESAPLSWQEAVELIDQVTGISQGVAQGLLAEIGVNMEQFPSAKHLASWVGICPGNHESAGKRLSGKTRKGNPYARRLLIQAAHAAAHSKNTYLAAQYRRIAARRGPKRAAVAVGHSILVIVYHLLRDRGTYEDLGGNYFDEHDRQMVQKHLVRRLERLGYQVDLQPRSEAR